MRNVFIYSLLRLLMLVGVVALVWLIAGISLISTILAILIATMLSLLLLGPFRAKATTEMVGWRSAAKQRRAGRTALADSDASAEDAEIAEEPGSEGQAEGEQR
ncbi:hypothetical protein GCM10022261_22500 [Brevibacterium daeguense]|uniref:DUF4229 domain-containing protein n=1 Tax=Brevibacterium daeguense TaxID=909936 RepID=A0ABP8EL67_9MICO|nr:DUF4229 domain-containing protein [Brevibacterium daeguense]